MRPGSQEKPRSPAPAGSPSWKAWGTGTRGSCRAPALHGTPLEAGQRAGGPVHCSSACWLLPCCAQGWEQTCSLGTRNSLCTEFVHVLRPLCPQTWRSLGRNRQAGGTPVGAWSRGRGWGSRAAPQSTGAQVSPAREAAGQGRLTAKVTLSSSLKAACLSGDKHGARAGPGRGLQVEERGCRGSCGGGQDGRAPAQYGDSARELSRW